MQGVLKVDGNDAYLNLGWTVTKGTYSALDKLDKPKENGLSMSFADEHGDDDYLGEVFLEAKFYTLTFNLKANSEADYYSKLNATKMLFRKAGEINFDFLQLGVSGRRFKLIYKDCSEFTRLTNVKSNTQIMARFTVLLKDNYPHEEFTVV